MKLPKTIKRYCPYCKRHTEHKVMISPKGQRSHLTKGERYRREKLEHGYGGFPYSIYKEGGRYKVKIAKNEQKADSKEKDRR
jgi:ribosomal protein L44E